MDELIAFINENRDRLRPACWDYPTPSVSFRIGKDGKPTNIWLRMVSDDGLHMYGEALPDVQAAMKLVASKCNVYRDEEQKPPADVDEARLAFED